MFEDQQLDPRVAWNGMSGTAIRRALGEKPGRSLDGVDYDRGRQDKEDGKIADPDGSIAYNRGYAAAVVIERGPYIRTEYTKPINKLSNSCRMVAKTLRDMIKKGKYNPTHLDIARVCGSEDRNVTVYLRDLERGGYIRREKCGRGPANSGGQFRYEIL